MTAFNESQAIPLLRLGVAPGWRPPAKAQKGMRVPAGDMEGLVLERLRAFFSSRIDIGQADVHMSCEFLLVAGHLCDSVARARQMRCSP
jgi:hypothetical protein